MPAAALSRNWAPGPLHDEVEGVIKAHTFMSSACLDFGGSIGYILFHVFAFASGLWTGAFAHCSPALFHGLASRSAAVSSRVGRCVSCRHAKFLPGGCHGLEAGRRSLQCDRRPGARVYGYGRFIPRRLLEIQRFALVGLCDGGPP